jgi:hypothetical protein
VAECSAELTAKRLKRRCPTSADFLPPIHRLKSAEYVETAAQRGVCASAINERSSEVALALLSFHGRGLIEFDRPSPTFRGLCVSHPSNDQSKPVRLQYDGAYLWIAAQRSKSARAAIRRFPLAGATIVHRRPWCKRPSDQQKAVLARNKEVSQEGLPQRSIPDAVSVHLTAGISARASLTANRASALSGADGAQVPASSIQVKFFLNNCEPICPGLSSKESKI